MSTPDGTSTTPHNSTSPPLVWVRQGKSQHAAHLLNNEGLVRWASTQSTDLVDLDTIEYELTPRRRGRSSSGRPDQCSSRIGSESSTEKKRKPLGDNRSIDADVPQKNRCTASAAGSDDDDVELLLTIMPPTPKRSKPDQPHAKTAGLGSCLGRDDESTRRSNKGGDALDHYACETEDYDFSLATTAELDSEVGWNFVRVNGGDAKSQRRSDNGEESSDSALAPKDQRTSLNHPPTTGPPGPTYTYRSSAYVQNLAELCYTIMYDGRWRVGGSAQRRLISWERGDDMTAVSILSRLYQPTKPFTEHPCSCLLCRETKNSVPVKSETTNDSSALESSSCDAVLSENSSADTDDRAVQLYCRLYYRRGPWFRLDDVYNRYYAPKRHGLSVSEDNVAHESQATTEQGSRYNAKAPEGRANYFQPYISTSKPRPTRLNLTKEDAIEENIIRLHLAALTDLLVDIDRLQTLGLIRSFRDEEECGKTAGAVTRDGSGLLLAADERRNVLTKLGCKEAPKKRQQTGSSRDRRSMRPIENAIWKQMRQQKSISQGLTTNGDGETGRLLLPVRRHINADLFNNIAKSMVLKSSKLDYIPARLLRQCVSETKKRIEKVVTRVNTALRLLAWPDTCFKLREKPLLTLRRGARLYLCATHGPGDMRCDGTNGWRSLLDVSVHSCSLDIPLLNVVRPPGAYSFYKTSYPAMLHRFGLTKYSFLDAHTFINCEDLSSSGDEMQMKQVFESLPSFGAWERSVELRAQVDYLIELNDLVRYMDRRSAREANETVNEDPEGVLTRETESSDDEPPRVEFTTEVGVDLDFLSLLTVNGRRALISGLLTIPCDIDSVKIGDQRAHLFLVDSTQNDVEMALSNLERGALHNLTSALSRCEQLICVIAVIVTKVLLARCRKMTKTELDLRSSRPWLRHMWWEAVLAYVLWDAIALLERKGLYDLAASAIEVLLTGSLRPEGSLLACTAGEPLPTSWIHPVKCNHGFSFVQLLVSRRTRGKLYERLVIDYTHLLRRQVKLNHLDDKEKKRSGFKRCNTAVGVFCRELTPLLESLSSVPFSAIRCLSRRVKIPLSTILHSPPCSEPKELGLRLDNIDLERGKNGYSDWTPTTDTAVANAMGTDGPLVGRRCSFVGFEENETDIVNMSSLNVEQLAMEFYSSGRLPCTEGHSPKLGGGGWRGWHDEGGHIRALFRILCSAAVFGMDSGCGGVPKTQLENSENQSIFLTPYQGAPHDLHVAFWMDPALKDDTDTNAPRIRGFFERRRGTIDTYLRRIERLDDQAICDLVHETILQDLDLAKRRKTLVSSVYRDLQQARTLSMLAAGFGGAQLAVMFRALLFDYRHYSGGLPDLLLVRARHAIGDKPVDKPVDKSLELVDLGEWVGESFSADARADTEEAHRASILIDKDDEFLGCTKVGDSAARSNGRWQQNRSSPSSRRAGDLSCEDIPDKLQLQHNGRRVQVQCLFVEVKSQNDRLDGRQEDWLNILDRVGNARVCKLGKVKKTRNAAKMAAPSND